MARGPARATRKGLQPKPRRVSIFHECRALSGTRRSLTGPLEAGQDEPTQIRGIDTGWRGHDVELMCAVSQHEPLTTMSNAMVERMR